MTDYLIIGLAPQAEKARLLKNTGYLRAVKLKDLTAFYITEYYVIMEVASKTYIITLTY